MKWKSFISVLFMAMQLVSCRREDAAGPDSLGLSVGVEFPYTSLTKAGPELPALDAENKIHSLSLWVFRHNDEHTPVGYLSISADELPETGGLRWYTIPVDWSFINSRPSVDVFVLANAAAIDCEGLNGDSTFDQVNGAVFGMVGSHDHFGVAEESRVTTVDPEKGLPMSGVGKNLGVYGSSPQLKVDAVSLVRAVSRLRMVFCRTATDGPEEEKDKISIDKIIIYGGKFPKQEYVFTTASTGIKILDEGTPTNNYDPTEYERLWPAGVKIVENEEPEDYIYINQDPVAYQADLDDAVAGETLTDLGYTYFRETDQKLMGRIYYTVNEKSRFREFAMASYGDFARNHTWTLFGYFVSDQNLQLSLSVQPWDRIEHRVDFSEQAVSVTQKFTVDDNTVQLKETSKDHFDAKLLPGKVAKGTLHITTPVGGTLMIYPEGAAHLFSVTPSRATINPYDNSGLITIEIRNAVTSEVDLDVLSIDDKSITLSFSIEHANREIDANTEIVDNVYRFIL